MSKTRPFRRRIKSNDRRVFRVEPIQTFLIVCEGKRTEPNYLRAFRVPKQVQVLVIGEGYNTISLVERAVELAAERDYDQVWCVFDRDDCSADSFNSAIKMAKSHGFRVAYSNEAFELWYLLHFHFFNTGIGRADYIKRLERELGREYRKNDKRMYVDLLPRQPEAIRNAINLLAGYEKLNPAQNNPSTTVHLLVGELKKYSVDAVLTKLGEDI